ncbi:hypothetical protein EDD86DRAFT_188416 [Gorgonomyces haynaldii]|nr:hypothetical protein EDD86DRAFT_188416 [Gorgonomyces haynaldii]
MGFSTPRQNYREPIRDTGITEVYNYFHEKNELPQKYQVPADKTFVRAFSWFPNSQAPIDLKPYIEWTHQFLADPRDTIFVTHVLFSYLVVVPSTLWLLYSFTWFHALLHTVMLVLTIPPYILMMHCMCHKRSGNERGWWLDASVHYVLAPFYGQTWNTFYYHHTKHHHIEDNGPDDLSSTIWYDRDNAFHFLIYYARFYFLCGIELPIYFIKRGKYMWALKTFIGEYGAWAFFASWYLVVQNPWSVFFAWFMPVNLTRIGMMSGNWGQHAFVEPEDALNDYKTALTCVNVPYNATSFNDGYHTSHHLNPVRHWQDHPEHFISSLQKFKDERVVIFEKLDFFMVTMLLLTKQHRYLAKCLLSLPGASLDEKEKFLRSRLYRLTPAQVDKIRPKRKTE